MATMQYEQELLDQIRNLPSQQVREVLDFASFLRQKLKREEDRLQEERWRASERMAARRDRIGPVDVRAAELVEEGGSTRVADILGEEKKP
jgi:uncharacterized protein DUF2281